MKTYAKMKKQEAAAALQEFLDERPHALEQLTRYLAEHSDGTVHLDETGESLTPPLALGEIRAQGTDDGNSWAGGLRQPHMASVRHRHRTDPVARLHYGHRWGHFLPVPGRGAGSPQAQWRTGYNRIKSYMWQNHPVLANDKEEVPLPDLVPGLARGQASGRLTSDDDKLTRTAAAVIRRLNGTDEETVAEDEPLIEVEDLGEDALRGRA